MQRFRFLDVTAYPILVLLVFSLFGSGAAQPKKKFAINGVVSAARDQKPISAAELELDPVKTKKDSDAAGEYRYSEVSEDTYTLTVKADGYRSVSRVIHLTKDSKQDFGLWPVNPDKNIYRSVGSRTVGQVLEKKTTYGTFWVQLRADAFPPTDKFWLIKEIDERDPQAKKNFKQFAQYLSTNVENIDKANDKFKSALEKKTEFPSTTFLLENKIGNEVVTDIVIFQLRTSPASKERKAQFLEEFPAQWKSKGMDKQIRHWLPK